MIRAFISLGIACLVALGPAVAATSSGNGTSDSSAAANTAFVQAIELYQKSQTEDAAQQKAAAIQVLRIFKLISTAYPASIPGKRILAGGKVGPIDLAKLRALASEKPAPAPAQTSQATKSSTKSASTQAASATAPAKSPPPPKWFQLVVPTGTPDGGYGFGQYPSLGQRTHPGIDLIAACGEKITAPLSGTVVKIIKAGDDAFPKTGDGVIIKYTNAIVPTSYTAYFFLGATPEVKLGPVKKGQVIGVTGHLQGQQSCGVHFEVRRHGPSTGLFMPLWHGVLGVGDWKNDPAFLKFWRDPEAWLKLLSPAHLLAAKDWVRVYRPDFLAQFNDSQRYNLGGSGHQWLTPQGTATLHRNGSGLTLRVPLLGGIYNPDVPLASKYKSAHISFSLRVKVVSDQDLTKTILDKTISNVATYGANGKSQFEFLRIADITIPGRTIKGGERIRFALIPNQGPPLTFAHYIELVAHKTELTPADREAAQRFADLLANCVTWDAEPGEILTLATAFNRKVPNDIQIRKSAIHGHPGFSEHDAIQKSQSIVKQLRNCTAVSLKLTRLSDNDWIPIELVLGKYK